MSERLFVKSTININAPASKVWNALTNPDETKKYMFGCEAISDWEIGSQLIWKAEYEGKETVFVKGEIIDLQVGKRLAYTTIDPNSDIDDTSENYLTVTYELFAENGVTTLNVTQGDYSTVADGRRRYEEAYNNGEGWNPILANIKKLVESE